jgi:hypothetical protein
MAKLDARRNELMVQGLWTETLDGGFAQAHTDHRKIEAAGGPRAFIWSTYGFCPSM